MENSTKALLIAAAVLIAIILVGMGITVLNSGDGVKDQAKEIGEEIASATDITIQSLGTYSGSQNWKESGDGIITSSDGKVVKKVGDTLENDEVLAATGGTQSSYKGKWVIIGVENNKLKLVSYTNVSEERVEIGHKDINAEGSNAHYKSIDSYLKVKTTLNNFAKEKTGIPSARSITREDIEKLLNITEAKKQSLNKKYGKTYTYTTGKFLNEDGQLIELDSGNENITLKYTYYYYSKPFKNSNFSSSLGKDGPYWLASHAVCCYDTSVNFCVGVVDSGGNIDQLSIFTNKYTSSLNRGVRAVVYI